MPDLTTITTLTTGTIVTGVAGWLSFRAFADARLLAEIGATPMGELTDGLHEVRGAVKAPNGVSAPVSSRPCVGWRIVVEQQRRSAWELIYDKREIGPFTMSDGTGEVQVSPETAELVLARTTRARNGVMPIASPEWTALTAQLGEPLAKPTTPFVRWREESIEDDDVLTAIGNIARSESGPWALAAENLLLSDRDDADVVRQQRRKGQRHALWAIAGSAVLVYGIWALLGG